jgi:lipoyl(octanoyl) transferase
VRLHLPGLTSYADGLALQAAARDRVVAGGEDELILLEHPPVVTLGKRGGVVDRDALRRMQTEVIQTRRGGLATWHGPGQLVGYVMVDLARRGWRVPHFVDLLGEALATVACDLGVHEARYDSKCPGVYVQTRKLGAIGLHLAHRITSHGFALNVSCGLDGFRAIDPCGVADRPITTLNQELRETFTVQSVIPKVQEALGARGLPLVDASAQDAR